MSGGQDFGWGGGLRRGDNDIKAGVVETGTIALRIQGQVFVNAVTNLRIPYNTRDFLTSSGTVKFSGRILLHTDC
jgi:hypothetical protein